MTLQELKKIINEKYLHRGKTITYHDQRNPNETHTIVEEFTLSSGRKSSLYFDLKSLFGNLHDVQILCEAVWWRLREFSPPISHFESFGGT